MVDQDTQHEPIHIPPQRKAWPLVLCATIILFSGVVIGYGISCLYPVSTAEDQTPPSPLKDIPKTPPPHKAQEIANKIASKFDLSQQQTHDVHKLLQGKLKEIYKLRYEMHNKVFAVHQQMRDEMKEILTPEQYKQWNEHFTQIQRRYYRSPHHGRGKGRGRYCESRRGGPPSSHGWHPFQSVVPETILLKYDTNKDGVIDFCERIAAPTNVHWLLDMIDRDKDGLITKEDIYHFNERIHPPHKPNAPCRQCPKQSSPPPHPPEQ